MKVHVEFVSWLFLYFKCLLNETRKLHCKWLKAELQIHLLVQSGIWCQQLDKGKKKRKSNKRYLIVEKHFCPNPITAFLLRGVFSCKFKPMQSAGDERVQFKTPESNVIVHSDWNIWEQLLRLLWVAVFLTRCYRWTGMRWPVDKVPE